MPNDLFNRDLGINLTLKKSRNQPLTMGYMSYYEKIKVDEPLEIINKRYPSVISIEMPIMIPVKWNLIYGI